MSRYTTEVRFVCEDYAGLDHSVGYAKVDEVVEASHKKIFDFDYPIFDESYRDILEKKILVHFYTREICEETVGLWKLRLRDKMNMIMPLYNQYYLSALIEFDPMKNIDEFIDEHYDKNRADDYTRTDNLTEEHRGHDDTTDRDQTIDKHGEWDLYSDTPQGSIERIDVDSNAYLTNARHTYGDGGGTTVMGSGRTDYNSDRNNRGTQRRAGTTDTTYGNLKHIFGMDMTKMGETPSKLLNEFRTTFLNIDAMVIEEMEDLFMQLW